MKNVKDLYCTTINKAIKYAKIAFKYYYMVGEVCKECGAKDGYKIVGKDYKGNEIVIHVCNCAMDALKCKTI